jgi:urease accessory protein
MYLKSFRTVLAGLVAFLVAPAALAHTGHSLLPGFADGFMHPASGLDHLLVGLAAGYWVARGNEHGVRALLALLAMFAAGMLVGVASVAYPQLQIAAMLLAVLTAGVIALAISYPRYFLPAFIGSCIACHGLVHSIEMSASAHVPAYAAGLLLATFVIMMTGQVIRRIIVTFRAHGTS